ncbi:MAG: disulfide oxidoreductase, partial [Pseudomonadota bacterium]
NPEATRLLWDVCRVPDFRKTLAESHTRLVGEIFRQLSSLKGVIDGDWAIGHVNHLDRVDGDIDTLMNRIAHVRTWTYIAHQGTWLPDGQDWQARTRHIEDRLSDALHGALSQRFIDRRSAVLVRQLGDGGPLAARIEKDGEVTLAGEYVGRLSGFSFTPDEAVHREDSKAILAAARRTLGQEINRRLDLLADDPDSTITLQPNGRLNWRGADIARLANGNDLLAPVIMPVSEPLLDKAAIARIEQRLSGWLSARVDRDLAPLRGLSGHELKGAARGIVFQLREEAGSIEREKVASLIADLSGAERAKLRDLGVRIGARFVFIDGAFSLRARRLLAILLGIFRGHALPIGLPPTLPISWRADDDIEPSLLRQIGYPKVGPLAVRVDRLELMLRRAHAASRRADAKADDLARTIGSSPEDLKPVLKEGGFKLVEENGVTKLSILRRKGGRRQRRKANPNSPFADLARLA